MLDFLLDYLLACWGVLREAAPWALLGFAAAGAIHALIPAASLARHLGGRGPGSVLKAALAGIPLPLCSCGVLPVAAGLRRSGAGRGATASFLVSTPETGVDSIAVTWALMDPLMTLLRPAAAFVTALAAGLAANLLPEEPAPSPAPEPAPAATGDCAGGCRSGACAPPGPPPSRLDEGLAFVRDDLLPDIGPWLLLGVLLAGLIALLVPESSLADLPGGEWGSMLAMLAVAAPLYICATSSTPVAAALVLKGLSPGAALVLLLAGPATNAATIAVVGRILGRGAVPAYVGAIAACSLAMGWAANRLYELLGIDPAASIRTAGAGLPPALEGAAAAILVGLVAWSLLRRRA
ncbi:MAG: SO_0444 family Cu/Zn efflux transporter [Thermodesulfobacteriota bacterium]